MPTQTAQWTYGYNRPGYLPDRVGQDWVDDFDTAKRCLIEEILFAACHDEVRGDELALFAEDVNLWSEPSDGISLSMMGPDRYIYWIMKEH